MASRITNTKHHSLLIDSVQSLIEKKNKFKMPNSWRWRDNKFS